jgi:hypothetical protein
VIERVPASMFAMAFQTVSDARFVQIGGQRLLVRCYDPESGEVVVIWPSDLSADANAGGHFVAVSIRRRHGPDEYVAEDDQGSWPTSGPCVELPTT